MMDFEPGPVLEELRSRLVGHRVTFRRLGCDMLFIYVGCEPGDGQGQGVIIMFNPIWHLRSRDGVLLGSQQVSDAMETNEALDAVSIPLEVLHERAIEGVVVEPTTHDLTVTFEGGYCIKTFVSDATADHSWHIFENATRTYLVGSPGGLSLVALRS